MQKSKLIVLSVIMLLFTQTLYSQRNNSTTNKEGDFFPKESVWLNTANAIGMNSLQNKFSIVLISDLNCLECGYYAKTIETLTEQILPIQLIQVVLPQNGNTYARSEIISFIQRNNYTHPIAIIPDLSGFKNLALKHIPHFLVYDKSNTPTISESSDKGFDMVLEKIEGFKKNKELAASYSGASTVPSVQTSHWANPVIENPTYIAADEYGSSLFVNDLAHHRMIKLDKSGNCELVIGSSILPGYSSNESEDIRFSQASGMTVYNGSLYVADTYNNRLRAIDIEKQSGATVLGNGSFDSLALPTDVELWKKHLYVADGFHNQIRLVNTDKKTSIVVANIPSKQDGLKRSYPVNLASGKKGLYIVMSNGEIFLMDKKWRLHVVPNADVKISAVAEWQGGLVGCSPSTNAIYFKKKDTWELLTDGRDSLSTQAGVLAFKKPFDLTVISGELYVTDTENHQIRVIHSTEENVPHRFDPVLSEMLISMEPSHTFGQPVEMDTIFIARETVAVKLKLNLQGYNLLKDGQNYAVIHGSPEAGELLEEQITKDEFSFTVNPNRSDELLYMELYLTLESEQNPGVAIIKRTYLIFQLETTTKADAIQELKYSPDLLPY